MPDHRIVSLELRKRLDECEALRVRKGAIQTNEGQDLLLHLMRVIETLLTGTAITPMRKTHHE